MQCPSPLFRLPEAGTVVQEYEIEKFDEEYAKDCCLAIACVKTLDLIMRSSCFALIVLHF